MATPGQEEVLERIRAALAVLDPDVSLERVTVDAELSRLELESVTLLSVVAELEDAYGIRIPESDMTELGSVADLIALVQRHAVAG